jgi:4-amino-4-deoxy-L-arabinose transferase-like glycosyltransferase
MIYDSSELSASLQPAARWWREWEAAVLGILVVAIYFARLTTAPICGEESRWADGAREMIASGDWIVPRQQGVIFPERPPLTSWAMALVGLARHRVDTVAIRLPSACAILCLTLLIYAYARVWISRLGSFSSAAIFATLGQVLGIGRFGESEAVFALFTAGALLVWHWGYLRQWSRTLAWSLGYSLAALGALTKGPQAPVYFMAVCGAYLLLRRDWRWLFCRGHLAGIVCFAAIVGAWLVPFAVSNWEATDDIWAGLAQDRFTTQGLLKHLATYPVETFGCLLPWSPLLLALVRPSLCKSLLAGRPPVRFLLVSLAVTYPTVWLAAEARGRYYMPLYPSLAILMGLVVEHCTEAAADRIDRSIWRHYLRGLSIASLVGGVGFVAAHMTSLPQFADARQEWPFLGVWFVAAAVTAGVLLWASLAHSSSRPQIAIVVLVGFMGLTYTGVIINSRVKGGNDLAPAVAQLKEHLPQHEQLFSLGSVYHRFSYQYESPIRRVPWPASAADVPGDVTYFCFDRRPGDNDLMRTSGDGRYATTTAGKLPFEWDEIAEIPCDPVNRKEHGRTIVVGRIRRFPILARPDVNRPAPR